MEEIRMKRRSLLHLPLVAAALPPAASAAQTGAAKGQKYRISLAEWSLHKAIHSRLMSNLEFPRIAREQFGIDGLEFVNQLWEAPTESYVRRLKSNMRSTGTTAVLLMVDGEGFMGSPDSETRMSAARNHYKWVDIAAELGCHSIRTNMYPGEKQPITSAEISSFVGHCAESFNNLCEYAAPRRINIIIENHGGISSNPDVVVSLMKQVNRPNFGTLPDFGNFPKDIDRYEAVAKLLPYAKGVSFKCFDFRDGRETTMDMDRMMKLVQDSPYSNKWIGIEYEGTRLTEFEGIQAAKSYLTKYAA